MSKVEDGTYDLKSTKAGKEKNVSNKNLHSQNVIHSNLDSNCLHQVSKNFVRIEYPGFVKNSDRAIETLGGINQIESAVADHKKKLELRFHPNNFFNKPCVADRDNSPGLLIKITQKVSDNVTEDSKKPTEVCPFEYEIIGATAVNFKFNRLCDFQYLPLVATDLPENVNSEVEYMYDKILPTKIPDMEWFLRKENLEQSKFFVPSCFARFDASQNKLYLNTGEKFGSSVRPDVSKYIECSTTSRSKKLKTIPIKQISVFVNFSKPNIKIPNQPYTYTMELVKERSLQKRYWLLKKFFDERPIWTKTAVLYKSHITQEHAKVLLPAIAYFCHMGPWRMCWIRYGYNPQEDFNSRIYQTLDYRIRATEGTKLKVKAKRSYTNKQYFSETFSSTTKISLKDEINSSLKKDVIEEHNFILKPNILPPARQMFYQYCDIMIPEIQEMIARLPKLSAGAKCDSKNGWLPVIFTEQCREIANKYVMDCVQNELLKDSKLQEEQNVSSDKEEKKENMSTYCSKMLSNIRKGIYKSVIIDEIGESSRTEIDGSAKTVPELVEELSDDELEQVDANEVVNSLPETMEQNSDDDQLEQDSDLEIDIEVVEEVNQMISGIQDDDDMNTVMLYLNDNPEDNPE